MKIDSISEKEAVLLSPYYPGYYEEEIQLAIIRANELVQNNEVLDKIYPNQKLEMPPVCDELTFHFDTDIDRAEEILLKALEEVSDGTREAGYILQNLGIVYRIKRNDEICLSYLTAAEIIGRNYIDLHLVAECLANRVDLFIDWANNPPSQERYDIYDLEAFSQFYVKESLVAAVEAFHLAHKIGRKDISWFLWKITEASIETFHCEYIYDYLVGINIEPSMRKAFWGTVMYGVKRVGQKAKIIKR